MRIILGAVVSIPPFSPGMVWNWMQHVVGLADLGHEVCFVEEVRPEWCVDERGVSCEYRKSVNRRIFSQVTERFGVAERACQLYDGGRETTGLTLRELESTAGSADLLINMSGHVEAEAVVGSVSRRAYVDQDPVYTQLWHAAYGKSLGLDRHDAFVTVGLDIGSHLTPIPHGGIRWRTTLPPVVMSFWPGPNDGRRARFTTVASWSGYGDLEYRGGWYRSKFEEFLRLSRLPREAGLEFEVALKAHRPDDAGILELIQGGWIVSDAGRIGDLDAYRRFIGESRAEIGVAKNAYVKGKSGWFGDRSAHYLASGRPVLAQATGFEHHLPTGKGLLSFSTLKEALDGARAIHADYEMHSRAAREIAEEYLDHRRVLPALLDACTGG